MNGDGPRLTEPQFRELLGALPHLVWTCLAAGPCDYLSRQWVEYTGIPEEKQLGYRWLEQLHPDDRERVKAEWAATVGKGVAFDIEFRIRRADGVHRWFRTRAIPLRDPSGQIVKWYGSNADIDDYKRTEEALRASEARLAATLDSIGDGLIATDVAGRIVRINPVAVSLTGWSAEAALGRPLDEVFRIIREGTRQTVESPAARVLREGIVVGLANHTSLIARDGTERPIADSGAPIRDASGAVTGVVLVFHDMTAERAAERRLLRSESRFRRLQEAGFVGIVLADLKGNILDANDEFLRMVGYTRDDLAARRVRWSEMTPPECEAQNVERIAQLRAQGFVTAVEREYLRKDGSRVPVLVGSALIDGSDEECIGFALDVTERKRAEEQIRALNADLERRIEERTAQLHELNRELEAFSYSVAHDLRAPLRGIAGFAQVLSSESADKLDADEKDALSEIHANAARMAELIDDLLQLSRASRGEIRPEWIDLAPIVRETFAQLAASEPRDGIELVVGDDLEVSFDPRLARAVVENLVSNAWKFVGKTPRPRIEVGSVPAADGKIVFVRDNGAGFDAAYVGKLFTPFQRLHSTTDFPGTGIGLATTQRIIRRHGGRIWAEGRVGFGATFSFQVPHAPEPESSR